MRKRKKAQTQEPETANIESPSPVAARVDSAVTVEFIRECSHADKLRRVSERIETDHRTAERIVQFGNGRIIGH